VLHLHEVFTEGKEECRMEITASSRAIEILAIGHGCCGLRIGDKLGHGLLIS
jgi:hypothetical protein